MSITLHRDIVRSLGSLIVASGDYYSYSMWRAACKSNYGNLRHCLAALHETHVLAVSYNIKDDGEHTKMWSGPVLKFVILECIFATIYRSKYYIVRQIPATTSTQDCCDVTAELAASSVYYNHENWASIHATRKFKEPMFRLRISFSWLPRTTVKIGYNMYVPDGWCICISGSTDRDGNLLKYYDEYADIIRLTLSVVTWLDLASYVNAAEVFS